MKEVLAFSKRKNKTNKHQNCYFSQGLSKLGLIYLRSKCIFLFHMVKFKREIERPHLSRCLNYVPVVLIFWVTPFKPGRRQLWIFLINFKLDIAFLCLLQVWNVLNHQNACNVGVFKKVMLQLEITIGHMGVVQATFILLLVQNILYNTDNYNAASTGLTIQ